MRTHRRVRSPRGSGEILAEEIIEAATELIVDSGDVADVSIRAVASRVGVTPPSIYLHFADKDALLDAVCARYFEQLDERLAAASAGVDDALDRALRLGLTYVAFALQTPVLYQVAFRAPSDPDDRLMVDEVLAASAYHRMSATVTELADEGLLAHSEVPDVVLELWAVAHGIASLMLSKPGLGWTEDLRHAETVMRAVCLGRAVMSTHGDQLDEPNATRAWLRSMPPPAPPNDNRVKRR